MADLTDFKRFADQMLPILKDLFTKAAAGALAPDSQAANDAIAALQTLVSESGRVTPAPAGQRAEAITAVRGVLTDAIAAAASGKVVLDSTDVRTMRALWNSLGNALGLLLEQQALKDIPQLLSPTDITRISTDLVQARAEIKQRRQAKEALDVAVKVIITAASLATKLAA
jgi:hypothetical protein